MLHCRIFHPTNRCISRGSTSRARSSSPGEGAVRQLGLVPKLIMCLITCPARRTACPHPPGVWNRAAVLGWSPGAPWIWGWCLAMLDEKGCVKAGLSQRRCPQSPPDMLGCRGPPDLLGCQSPPALSESLPAVLASVAFSAASVNVSCSTHICNSSAYVHLS